MLRTEERNPKTTHIDKMDTLSMLRIISEENYNAVRAVEKAISDIAEVIDVIAERMAFGGRLLYIGAGTSGRLGVIDAAECPPTFGVSRDTVIGIIAGGEGCMVRAAEGEEDDGNAGARDVAAYDISEKDTLIGISASGGAMYIAKALEYAKNKGAYTVSLSNNSGTLIESIAEKAIVADTGAEVIAGSTRMKAGTAQKLILNMISTSVMIKTGKVYENIMINLKPTNKKLTKRMIGIIMSLTGEDEKRATDALEKADWDIRMALDIINK